MKNIFKTYVVGFLMTLQSLLILSVLGFCYKAADYGLIFLGLEEREYLALIVLVLIVPLIVPVFRLNIPPREVNKIYPPTQ